MGPPPQGHLGLEQFLSPGSKGSDNACAGFRASGLGAKEWKPRVPWRALLFSGLNSFTTQFKVQGLGPFKAVSWHGSHEKPTSKHDYAYAGVAQLLFIC